MTRMVILTDALSVQVVETPSGAFAVTGMDGALERQCDVHGADDGRRPR